jgi:carbohydrate diacid regulator
MKMANETTLSTERCKIIIALADNKMNVSAVSRQLYMHRNTVAYNLEKIKQITGKDPLNFYDLYRLVMLAKEELAERWLMKNG